MNEFNLLMNQQLLTLRGNRDYFNIPVTPLDEPCIQAGGDLTLMYLEARAMIAQLIRMHGEFPEGFEVKTNRNPHDSGTYLDLQLWYEDTDNSLSLEYALKLEAALPEKWDQQAREYLKAEKYTTLTHQRTEKSGIDSQMTSIA